MKSVFAEAIQAGIDSREFEVTFRVVVSARNVGEAVKRASVLPDSTVITVKDVKEIEY
jgi:hypothetical protein